MEKIINAQFNDYKKLLQRPTKNSSDIEAVVVEIFSQIQSKGDQAIRKYTQLFDGSIVHDIKVSEEELELSKNSISSDLKKAIELAKSNIEKFHAAQKTERITLETSDGVKCWQEKRPIKKVGLYIPGGSAPLFSTILMLAVPARIAGCEEIVLCTPPNKDGNIHPAILYAARLCGVTEIFKVGGIQAIAALTFGTETIRGVYKIFGPGNQYVTTAKQMATKYNVAIDMPAGPSELLVFADDTAVPSFVAADLLSQAEHGVDSQVILITTSERVLKEVEAQILAQLAQLPRKEIASEAMENSKLIYVESKELAIEIINEYAPEHFSVCSRDEQFFIDHIFNAGSVLIGNYTPESAGDYASGTNHTLPTNGYAKQYSGVNLDSFTKSMTFQKINKNGIRNIGAAIEVMAAAEGLQAHKNAVTVRLKALEDENR
mgnify:FL=1|tara:strand:+ start:118156 stop:119451 length:1296 start_codon:yes stop_codon:yes gene_type:complete